MRPVRCTKNSWKIQTSYSHGFRIGLICISYPWPILVSSVLYSTILSCPVLSCIVMVLSCSVLYGPVLVCSVLYSTILSCPSSYFDLAPAAATCIFANIGNTQLLISNSLVSRLQCRLSEDWCLLGSWGRGSHIFLQVGLPTHFVQGVLHLKREL